MVLPQTPLTAVVPAREHCATACINNAREREKREKGKRRECD